MIPSARSCFSRGVLQHIDKRVDRLYLMKERLRRNLEPDFPRCINSALHNRHGDCSPAWEVSKPHVRWAGVIIPLRRLKFNNPRDTQG